MLDSSQLTMSAYQESVQGLELLVIKPAMLLPTAEANNTSVAVWKSQIAQVLMNKLAVPKDKKKSIPSFPPLVEKITPVIPEIYMLKLMDLSDNSAKGIGQVFEAFFSQTGLSINEFFG
jgi:hypothetical protein